MILVNQVIDLSHLRLGPRLRRPLPQKDAEDFVVREVDAGAPTQLVEPISVGALVEPISKGGELIHDGTRWPRSPVISVSLT